MAREKGFCIEVNAIWERFPNALEKKIKSYTELTYFSTSKKIDRQNFYSLGVAVVLGWTK